MPKLQQIHEFLNEICKTLKDKRDNEEDHRKINQEIEINEHTEGQLYEANYIADHINKIIFEGNDI